MESLFENLYANYINLYEEYNTGTMGGSTATAPVSGQPVGTPPSGNTQPQAPTQQSITGKVAGAVENTANKVLNSDTLKLYQTLSGKPTYNPNDASSQQMVDFITHVASQRGGSAIIKSWQASLQQKNPQTPNPSQPAPTAMQAPLVN